jgi:hypothetical protein
MGAHQRATSRAGHKCRHGDPLMLAAIAASVARDFGFWYGTHDGLYLFDQQLLWP